MSATRTASGYAESDAIQPAQLRGAELPEDWRWEKLGDICKTTSGGTPSRSVAKYFNGNIPWVKSGELPDGVVSEIEEHITEEAIRNSSAKLFPAGTLLIALYGATVGKLGVLSRNATTNQAVCGIFPPDSLDRKYLFWYLRFVRSDLIAQAIGGAQPNISQGILRNLLLPIPPPEQQERIVAEIEKQFSRLDEAVASLKRTKANLKRYKVAVLKTAVEGKLTEDWRLSARAASRKRAQASELEVIPKAGRNKWFVYIIECDDGSYYVGHTADLHDRWQRHCEGSGADWTRQHPPKYLVHFEECESRDDAVKREQDLKTGFGRTWRKREIDAGRMKPLVHNPANETAQPVHGEDMQTGSKLLERILAERRAKLRGRGKHKEPVGPDDADLPTLPKGWTWATVEQLASELPGSIQSGPFGSHLLHSEFVNKGILAIGIDNIHDGNFSLGSQHRITPQKFEVLRKFEARPGDVVITVMATVGRVCVLPRKLERAIITKHCYRITPTREVIDSEYLAIALRAESSTREHIFGNVRGQTRPGINGPILKAAPVALPSIREQQQIVAEVERRLSVIDELEATIDANLTRADRLRQSILGQAFSGKLLFNGERG